jgi:hypothetical protein
MKTTSGYRLVLPPGWVQVPVRDSGPGTAHEVNLGSATDDPLAVVTAIAEGAAADGGEHHAKI